MNNSIRCFITYNHKIMRNPQTIALYIISILLVILLYKLYCVHGEVVAIHNILTNPSITTIEHEN